MAFKPTVMVIDSLATDISGGTQNIDLLLLTRGTYERYSSMFHKTFSDLSHGKRGTDHEVAMIHLARENATEYLGKQGSSQPHQRRHKIMGTKYHMGDIITEQEAFDFGYVLPRIYTAAGKIAEIYHEGVFGSRSDMDSLTNRLREEKLITAEQSAIARNRDVHVIANERADEFRFGPECTGRNCASHPITLNVFSPRKDGFDVGSSYYVQKENTTYEFMVTVPLDR